MSGNPKIDEPSLQPQLFATLDNSQLDSSVVELKSRLDAVVDENTSLLGALEGQQTISAEQHDAFVHATIQCEVYCT